jgi:hypothetical protein
MILQIADTLNPISEGDFKTFLWVSEIVVTGIILVGIYLIFKPMFNKKED